MAYIQKRGKSWQARISQRKKIHTKQPDGTYKIDYKLVQTSKSGFKTKRAAKEYAIKMENDITNGVNIADNPTFYNFFQAWINEVKKPTLRPSTFVKYEQDLKRLDNYFRFTKIKDIKRLDYQQFINQINVSTLTLRMINRRYRACVKYAILESIISNDFTQGVELSGNDDHVKHPQYLNIREIKALTNYVKDNRSGNKLTYYMILTSLYTGARYGEIAGLQWQDLNFKDKTISISHSWHPDTKELGETKNKQSIRTIVVTDELLKILNELKTNNNNLVFATKNGHVPPAYSNMSASLKLILNKLNINKKDFTMHSLRHCHVALLHSQGVDWYAISRRLGHKDLSTTLETYAYMIDEEKRKSNSIIQNKLHKILD